VRSSDPLESVDLDVRRAVMLTVGALIIVVLYAFVFPTQVALVAMIGSFFVMIMLHETGHFVMAKRAGMKVTEFFVGFGPRLWSVRKGETEYGVKAIPLGGYCKVIGMTNLDEVDPDDEPRTYRAKPWHSKVSMAVAGPTVHFIIAIVLMFTVLFFAGDYRHSSLTTTLDKVTDAAADAHLQKGDQIVAIDNVPVTKWNQVHDLVSGPADHPAAAGTTRMFEVKRNGVLLPAIPVTLREVTRPDQSTFIGAGVSPQEHVPHPGLVGAAVKAPRAVVSVAGDSVKALGTVFSPSGISNYLKILSGDKGKDVDQSKRFVSPVGFGQLANNAVRAGWVTALGLLIAINVFLGLFNLLPLLPFDGGHIAIATYEKIMSTIRRRRVQVDIAKLMPVMVAVMAVLAFIFLSSLYLDIAHPVANPF
jgi:membrane-associated protease RseP (regulator of RpoE activity)